VHRVKAVAYVFWGDDRLTELLRSVASVRKHVTADIIAITDSETANRIAPHRAAFDRIITHNFKDYSNLAKSDVYTLVPPEFASFLYLDIDTVVLGDISYGFSQAARYGVAATIAPHYNLEYYWGFDSILRSRGIETCEQPQYNAGVLFIHRSAAVAALMRRWSELAWRYGPMHGYKYDQPFLSLAIHELRFNPATLSPAYNYRAFGEIAIGPILVWHSRTAVPSDVNATSDGQVFRRFVGSRRAIVGLPLHTHPTD
jgi:lipopolysaccharide biosynthesis glycosyltransferase